MSTTPKSIDGYLSRLSEEKRRLSRRFGQINPGILGRMLGDRDPKKAKRVMEAMLKMKKIVIADLKKAYDEE